MHRSDGPTVAKGKGAQNTQGTAEVSASHKSCHGLGLCGEVNRITEQRRIARG